MSVDRTGAKISLLVMSDMHGQFSRFNPALMPPGHEVDAVLIAGDFTNLGDRRPSELADARSWVTSLRDRYDRVWYVTGNHDFGMSRFFDDLWMRPSTAPPASVWDLEGREAMVEGLRVVGINLSPCFDAPELKAAWTNMTDDRAIDAAAFEALPAADIVVSHAPPLTWLDSTGGNRRSGPGRPSWVRNIGSPGLLAYIERHKPRLVICGHVHEAAGEAFFEHEDGSETAIYNVARTWRVINLDASGRVLPERAEVRA